MTDTKKLSKTRIFGIALMFVVLLLWWEGSMVTWAADQFMTEAGIKPPSDVHVEPQPETDREHLHAELLNELFSPMINSSHVNFGKYDKCADSGTPIVWIISAGHYRTFSLKLPNYESFVEVAPCRFEIVYTRSSIEASGNGWWGDREKDAGDHINDCPLELAEQYASDHTNFAYHVVDQGQRLMDTWVGAVALVQAVADYHNIPLDRDQIFVYTRPDVLFSHKVDFDALRAFGSQVETQNWLIVTPHTAGKISGYDPSELFAVGNWGYFLDTFHADKVRKVIAAVDAKNCTYGLSCCWWTEDVNGSFKTCYDDFTASIAPAETHVYRMWYVHDGVCDDTTVVMMGPTMKPHVFRLGGAYGTAVNRPGNTNILSPNNAISQGSTDISMWSGGKRKYIRGVPEESSCWEEIRGTARLTEWEDKWKHLTEKAIVSKDDTIFHGP